jgi:hypothetical protein
MTTSPLWGWENTSLPSATRSEPSCYLEARQPEQTMQTAALAGTPAS